MNQYMLRSMFYVCPVCGNVIHSMGQSVVSCHGVTLNPVHGIDDRDRSHDDTKERMELEETAKKLFG